ncbi:MAG: lamin tail domain-containing protein [bacterium]
MNKKLIKSGGFIILCLGMLFHSACFDTSKRDIHDNEVYNTKIVINEAIAEDTTGGNDWIELYITADEAVYLGDYRLAVNNEEPVTLPDIALTPGSFVIIQATADEPGDDSPYVPFTLSSDGLLKLFWGSEVIDVLDLEDGEAPPDFSYGRFPDGTGQPRILSPTPGTMNMLASGSPFIINEIVARAADGGPDWIELYVTGHEPVYLGDYSLVDDNETHEPALLPDITLQPGQFFVILATAGEPGDGSYYVPFGLGSDDGVTLYREDDIVDVLDWLDGDAPFGSSYGRLPDGSGVAQTLTPTPGESNRP